MKNVDQSLDRLFRAAAAAQNAAPNEMPFGFATRVLAQAHAGIKTELTDVRSLLRRVIFISLAVIALSGAGVYHELRNDDYATAPLTDEYAIADSAIGNIFEP
ncbi:MAG TPA: hypothetical protein VGI60_09120 [Chthoniobacterales bacterium]|jgi:hypothetical protein